MRSRLKPHPNLENEFRGAWSGYRNDLPEEDEQHSLAFVCPSRAAREFDAAER